MNDILERDTYLAQVLIGDDLHLNEHNRRRYTEMAVQWNILRRRMGRQGLLLTILRPYTRTRKIQTYCKSAAISGKATDSIRTSVCSPRLGFGLLLLLMPS